MHIYSFSQIQTYKRCPLQYRFRYIDKRPEKDQWSVRMQLWSAVHTVLEHIHKTKLEKKSLTLTDVRVFFSWIWSRYEIADNTENETLKEQWLGYVSYYCSDVFPHQVYETVGIEQHVMITTKTWHKLRGFVDRIDRHDGDLYIHDYKTNSHVSPEAKKTHLDQLCLYAQAYKDKADKIYGVLHYLHLRETELCLLSESDQWETMKNIQSSIDDIEQKRIQYQLFWDTDVFEAHVENHCGWCPFGKVCPAV